MSTRHDGMWAKPGFQEDLWVWSRPKVHGDTSIPVELEQGYPIQTEGTVVRKSSRLCLNTQKPSRHQHGFADSTMGGEDICSLGKPINKIHGRWVGEGSLEPQWLVTVLSKISPQCLLPSLSVLLFSNCPVRQDQVRIKSEPKKTFQSNVTSGLGLRWNKWGESRKCRIRFCLFLKLYFVHHGFEGIAFLKILYISITELYWTSLNFVPEVNVSLASP